MRRNSRREESKPCSNRIGAFFCCFFGANGVDVIDADVLVLLLNRFAKSEAIQLLLKRSANRDAILDCCCCSLLSVKVEVVVVVGVEVAAVNFT
jgi:hypothetical protein